MIFTLGDYRRYGLLLWLAAIANSSAIAAESPAIQMALRQAAAFEKAGKLVDARETLAQAIDTHSGSSALHLARARILIALEQGPDAEAEVRRARELGASDPETRHLLGHAILLQDEPQRSLRELRAGPVAEKYIGYAARIAANAALDLDDFTATRENLDIAIRRDPRNSNLWSDVARFRYASADLGGAVEAVDYALNLNRTNVRAMFVKAGLVREVSGLLPSLVWYERVLEAKPNHIEALVEYAATLGDVGRYTDALAVTRRILKLDKKNPRAFLLQATMAARAGRYELARVLLFKTGENLNDLPAFLLISAIVEQELGNYNIAADHADRLLNLQPNNFIARRILAAASYGAGDATESETIISPILDRPDTDSWSIMLAALSLEDKGQGNMAVPLLMRAANFRRGKVIAFAVNDSAGILATDAAANPNSARFVIPYIRSQVSLGNTGSALVAAQRLRRINPGVPDAAMLIGDIDVAASRYGDAILAYRQMNMLKSSEAGALRLANAYTSHGQSDNALATLAQFIERNPENVAVNRTLASAYLDKQDWARAAATLEMLRARSGNGDALLMTELGNAYMGLGKPVTAARYFYHGYQIQPMNPDIAHALGWAMYRGGMNRGTAVTLLEKAVIMQPGNALFAKRLALIRN